MHVLVLAIRRWIIKTKFAYLFFLAKWLSNIFDRMILRKKEAGRRPSCPPISWLLKKATRTFNFFMNFFISKKIQVTYKLGYVTNFCSCMILLRI